MFCGGPPPLPCHTRPRVSRVGTQPLRWCRLAPSRSPSPRPRAAMRRPLEVVRGNDRSTHASMHVWIITHMCAHMCAHSDACPATCMHAHIRCHKSYVVVKYRVTDHHRSNDTNSNCRVPSFSARPRCQARCSHLIFLWVMLYINAHQTSTMRVPNVAALSRTEARYSTS